MKGSSEVTKAIAEDLWQRFRLLAMVIDKADSFVGMTPGGTSMESHPDSRGESGWIQSLAKNEDEVRAIALDLVLRALRVALEPTNFTILRKLKEQPSVSFADLMSVTELNRLSVSERVNDLIQVGLAVKDIQTGEVQGTGAAEGLLDFVQQTQHHLCSLILENSRNRNQT